MRVALMGQAAFGEAVLKRLRDDGVEICVVAAPSSPGRPDPLWSAAEVAGLPLIATETLREPDGLARWRGANADLGVMAFVTHIIPEEALAAPTLGTIQYHPSLLPLHRGSSAINWAIINGDAETGLSIFWPDRGVDTGPILLQKRTPLSADDTVASVYFNRLFPMGVEAIAESVRLVTEGRAPRIEQDHRLSTYEPPCADEHGQLRWWESAERVSQLIRGCNPQPGAWTTFEGQKLRIFDCRLTGEQEAGMPGRVLRVDGDGFDVRLNGGVLRVLRVQPDGAKKLGAGEWAASAGLAEGYRFR